MSFRYDLTAVQILNRLGYTEPVGKDALLQAEQEKNIKLPPVLFEFLSLTADSLLFKTADIWTEKLNSLFFSYDGIQEWIDGDKEYWEKEPEKYADNEYYQLYKTPKEQWGERVSNYLLIGSDYGAGIAKFGIRLEEIGQEDPPVYMLFEDDPITDWKIYDQRLSDFLMRSLCDVLCCGEYDTAQRVLGKMGWAPKEIYPEDIPGLDLDAVLKYRSTYGADAVCGCAYDEESHFLVSVRVDREEGGVCNIMTYQKK